MDQAAGFMYTPPGYYGISCHQMMYNKNNGFGSIGEFLGQKSSSYDTFLDDWDGKIPRPTYMNTRISNYRYGPPEGGAIQYMNGGASCMFPCPPGKFMSKARATTPCQTIPAGYIGIVNDGKQVLKGRHRLFPKHAHTYIHMQTHTTLFIIKFINRHTN